VYIMGRRKKGDPVKQRVDARVEVGLLGRVTAAIAEDAITLTRAIEEGLTLWLKARARRKADKRSSMT
jgi:hypothetical protein